MRVGRKCLWLVLISGALAYLAAPRCGAAEPPSRSYRGQMLVLDGVGILSGVGAHAASSSWRSSTNDPPTLLESVATGWYAVGGVGAPALHWAHRNTALGFLSLGTRTLLPPLIGVSAYGVGCLRDGEIRCSHQAMSAGVVLGEVGAAAVDVLLAEEQKPHPAERWYGWQTLLVDGALLGASAGLVLHNEGKSGKRSEYPLYLSAPIGWYAFSWLGAPVVHLAHGRVGRGFGALGIRLVGPPLLAVAGVMGACAGLAGRDGCSKVGALAGLGGGTALVSALDAFLLAREPAVEEQSVSWIPLLSVTSQQFSVGLAGTI